MSEELINREYLKGILRNYIFIFEINILEDTYTAVYVSEFANHRIPHAGCGTKCCEIFVNNIVDYEYQDAVRKFVDLSTVEERLKNRPGINMDYRRPDGGWSTIYLNPSRRGQDGRIETIFLSIHMNFGNVDEAECKKKTLESHRHQDIMQALSSLYVAVFHVNLTTGTFSVFRTTEELRPEIKQFLGEGNNAIERIYQYIDLFVEDSDKRKMREEMTPETILEHFEEQKRYSVHYAVKDNLHNQKYFEIVMLDESYTEEERVFVMGFRCVDETAKKEILQKRELEQAHMDAEKYLAALEEAMDNTNKMYQEILQMQSVGIFTCRVESHKVITMNEAAIDMLEIADSYWEGMDSEEVYAKVRRKDWELMSELVRKLEETGEAFEIELGIEHKDGKKLEILCQGKRVYLENKEKILIYTMTDITEKVKLRKKLIEMSEMDALTEISNRGCGERQIDETLGAGKQGVFALFDVDKFKSFNDCYGHMVGDKVLKSVADCMKRTFSKQDTIMRLGGDEFAVFMSGVTRENAEKQIRSLSNAIDHISIPEITNHKITISLGAVVCEEGMYRDFDQVYNKADLAMYECKRQQRGTYCFVS